MRDAARWQLRAGLPQASFSYPRHPPVAVKYTHTTQRQSAQPQVQSIHVYFTLKSQLMQQGTHHSLVRHDHMLYSPIAHRRPRTCMRTKYSTPLDGIPGCRIYGCSSRCWSHSQHSHRWQQHREFREISSWPPCPWGPPPMIAMKAPSWPGAAASLLRMYHHHRNCPCQCCPRHHRHRCCCRRRRRTLCAP